MKSFNAQQAASLPYTWWLTGLAGAGKTTLAQALGKALRARGIAVCVLDGDILREGLSSDLGFSPADRAEQGRRAAEMAHILNTNGICAIVALISPSAHGRACAKAIIGPAQFIEVHIATPLAVCEARDPKGLYAKAAENPDMQLTGISAPYDVPTTPACVIDTNKVQPDDAVRLLWNARPCPDS